VRAPLESVDLREFDALSTSRTFTDPLRPPCRAGVIMGATIPRSGNEGHGGPPQGGVQAFTSGALQRISAQQ
jgi:hypothetical protein